MEELVIQSNVANLELVEDYLWNVCEEREITDYYGIISVSVIQAVKNSIVHGNREDESKEVHILCSKTSCGISVSISDEGEGFESAKYGTFPTKEGDKQGVYLIRHLADNVSFTGNQVLMEFMLSGVDERFAANRRNVLENFAVRDCVRV